MPPHPRGQSDSLAHYLECTVLWKCIESASTLRAGSCAASRLGLCPLSGDPRLLGVAHMVYHFFKFHPEGILVNRIMYYIHLERHIQAIFRATTVAIREFLEH